jgi:ornithine cyclodeaminase/alanine dehydrogenase-like protein (mu-crystallin family)
VADDLPWLDARTMVGLVSMAEAASALEVALIGGLDPAADPPRNAVDVRRGQLLLMPSDVGAHLGIKVLSIAPGNPDRGLARIQAVYVLFDSETLTPVALLDGTALTSLRTPAVSAVAVRHLAAVDATTLVVFGCGPQAWGHVEAARAVRPINQVIAVGRDPGRAGEFAQRVTGAGVDCVVGDPSAVADADIVVCATTAGHPLFPGDLVRDEACIVAVGAYEPQRRELDSNLMGRATVVVEDASTALREAGDVVLAVAEGALNPADLVSLPDLVTGRVLPAVGRPRVFKSVGMAWEDLVVAAEIHDRYASLRRQS